MREFGRPLVLPYSLIVGQERLKLALELAYIAPHLRGVLISGQPGTGKSTAVRGFAEMMFEDGPVTLPINATEDRVVGGWQIDELMRGEATQQPGLLEEANGKLLYIDEVNLLDDHIVNMILDVSSTGILVIQREGLRLNKAVSFTMVGTMNPEEGGLRPQLLDRFGLMVNVTNESREDVRTEILQTMIAYDQASFELSRGGSSEYLTKALERDRLRKNELERAKNDLFRVAFPEKISHACIAAAGAFGAVGHRGDYVMAVAARAHAALNSAPRVCPDDVRNVAPLALVHRRAASESGEIGVWTEQDDKRLQEILENG
jgi:magnesium chelatase subunit I